MGLVAEIATLDLLDALGVVDGARHVGMRDSVGLEYDLLWSRFFILVSQYV
jgi:hypothetical protein